MKRPTGTKYKLRHQTMNEKHYAERKADIEHELCFPCPANQDDGGKACAAMTLTHGPCRGGIWQEVE